MKYGKILVSSAAAIALASSLGASEIRYGAVAANLTAAIPATTSTTLDVLYADSGTHTIALETTTYANCTTKADTAIDKGIYYYSSVALNSSSTLTFNVTGGALTADATMFLLAWDETGADWVTVGTLNDFTADANGNYTAVRFQMSSIDNLGIDDAIGGGDDLAFSGQAGAVLAAATQDNVLPANTTMVISTTDATVGWTVPSIVKDTTAMTVSDDVKISLPIAKDDNANDLMAPRVTAETTIIDVASTMAATLTFNGNTLTHVIDVEADRKGFVADAGDATLTTSLFNVAADCTAEIGFVLQDATDTFSVTAERSNTTGVTVLDVATGAGVSTLTTGVAATYTSQYDADDIATAKTATITVNGTDVLSTGQWTSTVKVNPDSTNNELADIGEVTLLSSVNSTNWTINGSQFIIPSFNTSADYGTYIVVTNTSATDAAVEMDVWADKAINAGQTQVAQACVAASVGTVPANSTRLISPTDIQTGIDTACAGFSTTNNRYMGKFTVIAPDDSVHAAAFQKDGTVKRAVPVLTGTAHDWKE